MRTTLFLLLFLITSAAHSSLAQHPEPTSLKGLKRVVLKVYADRGIPSIPSRPVQPIPEAVEERAVKRLKEAGIEVMSANESQSFLDVPILDISLYLQCPPNGASCGYLTELELRERVQLARDRGITVTAITWRNSYTSAVDKAKLLTLPDQLMVNAGTLVLDFVSDYRTANSK